MRFSWETLGLVACVMASGCSGSSNGGGASCSSFTACGGSVVGTWNFTNECQPGFQNPYQTICSSSTFSLNTTVGGSITFQANGMYSATTNATANETLTIPNSCLTFGDGGFTLTCAQLQADIDMPNDAGPTPMGTCNSSSGGCSCQVTFTQPSTSDNGTYATSGDMITLSSTSGGTGIPRPYCVQGNTLLVETRIADPDAGIPNSIIIAATR